jgi:hypothetical protein
MQMPRQRFFSLSSGLHKMTLDHRVLPARLYPHNSSLTCIVNSFHNFFHPSWCFWTHIRGAHNLSGRYKSLESNVRPEYLCKQVEGGIERPLAPGEGSLSSGPSQEYFFDTGVSALQMERISIKGKSILRPKPIIFYGIPIPPKPPPPASDGMSLFKVVCLLLPTTLYQEWAN